MVSKVITKVADISDSMILGRIRASKVGQEIVAEIEAERLAERRALVAEVSRVRADLEAQLPALEQGLAEARAGLVDARAALKAAEQAYIAAEVADRNARSGADMAIGRLEKELIESASPTIADFLQWLSEAQNAQRRHPPAYETPVASAIATSRLKPAQIEANRKLGQLWDGLIQLFAESRTLAEGLLLEALTEAEVESRLGSMKGAILKAQVALLGGQKS